jgi:amino acid transporter
MKLQRSISTLSLIFAAVGGIVGSGWLFGPLYAAQIAGPAAILSWMIGGILMIIIAMTFAELATAFPVAGGMVRFAELSHGPLMSFTIGWMVWLSSVVVAPVETLALIQYTANYIPGLIHKVNNTHLLSFSGFIVAAVLMFVMCYLNMQGAKFFSKTSSTIVTIKLIVPLLTLIILLVYDFHSANFHASGGFLPYGWQSIFAALPLGGVIFSFIGYSPAIQLAEEAKNPQRAIPLAIIGSLSFCIIMYALLQIAFIGSLNPQYLISGWKHLAFSGDNGPFAGILTGLGITWLVLIIYGDAFISPFGTAFIYTASTARVNYAMSQTGVFPQSLQKLNSRGIPTRALYVNYIVGMLLFLPFPGWQSMVSFIISCFVISYSIGPIALITLRQAFPNVARPFRLPYANVMVIIAFYICNLIIFWTGWHTVSELLIAIAIGLLFFLYRNRKFSESKEHWQRGWWLFPYLLGLGTISCLGSFGNGSNFIKFGYDFIIIGLFTLAIYFCAFKSIKLKLTASSTL